MGFEFKPLTLIMVFARDRSKILLGMKKRGFGSDRYNGFGGKVEPGETIEQGAIRELKEESNLNSTSIEPRGQLFFEFEGSPKILHVHVFEATEWTGEPQESEEMRPEWFPLDSIPFDRMWLDDRHWFPRLLAGTLFTGYFLFQGEQRILTHTLVDGNATFEDLRKRAELK